MMKTNALTHLEIQISYPDAKREELSVDADRAMVGSGAHCEVRLPPEDCPFEQLVLKSQSGGVFGEARTMSPPALLNGAPFTQGRLLPDATLQIGRLTLRVRACSSDKRPLQSNAKATRTSPAVLAMGIVGFPAGIYLLLATAESQDELGQAPPAPSLFAAEDSATCAHEDPNVAAAQASADLVLAESRRERSPFSPEAGVAAVELFGRAVSCLQAAGAETSAEFVQKEVEDLQKVVSRDFHIHQVRLERALSTQDYDAAHIEIRFLKSFLATHSGPYKSWLSDLERSIRVKFSGQQ